jgi:hypothetical protein
MTESIDLLLAERAIRRVLTTYSRGVDRFDFEAVRSCYWPDGTDDHGSFVGGRDEFITFVSKSLQRFERTAHFLGNVLIDVDLVRDVAAAETYAVAYTATPMRTASRPTCGPACATSTASSGGPASGASANGSAPTSGGVPTVSKGREGSHPVMFAVGDPPTTSFSTSSTTELGIDRRSWL